MKEFKNFEIPNYLPSTKEAFISEILSKEIKKQGVPINQWLLKSIKLGLMIEESEVYQNIGSKEDKCKLSMEDFIPYWDNSTDEGYLINIPQKYVNRIVKCLGARATPTNIDKWIRKTFLLGINNQQIDLYKKNEEKYEKIDFLQIDISDLV